MPSCLQYGSCAHAWPFLRPPPAARTSAKHGLCAAHAWLYAVLHIDSTENVTTRGLAYAPPAPAAGHLSHAWPVKPCAHTWLSISALSRPVCSLATSGHHSMECASLPTSGPCAANVWPFPHQEEGSNSGGNPTPDNLPLPADLTAEQMEQLADLVKTRLDQLDANLFDGLGPTDNGHNFEGLMFEARQCEMAQYVARNAAGALLTAQAQEEAAIATAAAARAAAEGAEVAAAAQGPQARSPTRGCSNHEATRGLVANTLRSYGHVWPHAHRACSSVMSWAQTHLPSSWILAQMCSARSQRANQSLTVTASKSTPHWGPTFYWGPTFETCSNQSWACTSTCALGVPFSMAAS